MKQICENCFICTMPKVTTILTKLDRGFATNITAKQSTVTKPARTGKVPKGEKRQGRKVTYIKKTHKF